MTTEDLKTALREVLLEVLPPLLRQAPPAGLLSLEQAAQHLGLGRSTIRRLAQRVTLASVKSGRRLLFKSSDLDAYAEARRRSPELVTKLSDHAVRKEQER